LAAQAGSAAQPGSAAQVGAQSQLVRPRRPRPAAEAVSAATRPTMTNTKSIETIVEKRFIEKLLEKNRTESQSLED
jgi:surfactin synthase thioesterase subunit